MRVDVLAGNGDKSWYLVLYPDLARGVGRSWVQASSVEMDKTPLPPDRVGAAFLTSFAETLRKR